MVKGTHTHTHTHTHTQREREREVERGRERERERERYEHPPTYTYTRAYFVQVQRYTPNRTAVQCRERYCNVLKFRGNETKEWTQVRVEQR